MTETDFRPPTPDEVRQRLAEVRQLAAEKHLEPALLLGWAAMEAVARPVAGDRSARPPTPGQILETLAMEGYLTPSEADRVRILVHKRNRLIHGELDIRVSEAEIEDFVRAIEQVHELVLA